MYWMSEMPGGRMKAPMEKLVPLIQETVSQGGVFRLVTAGTSMYPLLRDRTDTVILGRVPEKLRRFDILLYRRANGQYVLHRAMKVTRDGCAMCGDHQLLWEKGIKNETMIAAVQQIVRGDHTVSLDSFAYRLYVFLWCRCFFLRVICLKLRAVPGKIQNKKKGRNRYGEK